MGNFLSSNFIKVRLGLPMRYRLKWKASAATGQVMGPSSAARTDLGSSHLENCTIGKLPLGKMLLK